MHPDLLKQIIIDQQKISVPSNFYARQVDYSRLQDNPHIIIVTGIRRCGKSTLLQILRKRQRPANYYLNFDDERLIHFKLADFHLLQEVFIELFGVQQTFFFDEIQNIPGWERFIRRLHDEGNKIYITGSNATMFSRELGTRLTGRYLAMELFPYSFRETVQYHAPELLTNPVLTTDQTGLARQLFDRYCNLGGIPEYNAFQHMDYLQNLYDSILYRDIVARYHITQDRALKELVFYLASHLGKTFSFNRLKDTLALGSATTVADYCRYLEDSYICFFINKYAHSLKQQIRNPKKVYFIDHLLAKAVGFRISEDRGRLLENIVFLELKRRYKEIYYHQQERECDFIIKEGPHITQAIQVTQSMAQPQTRERELAGLLDALNCYGLDTGYIITLDKTSTETIEYDQHAFTIKIVSIWQWLWS